jgi:8-oxo-dGTP diphosphatase
VSAPALVRVAAAVVLRGDGSVLLAQRPPGKVYAGYWEFPGGKLEAGETPRHALDRELEEELGIHVTDAAPWLVRRYVYPHAHVELHFFRVFAWEGEPVGHDGQAFAWQDPAHFTVAPLLPANAPILRALLLPDCYGITMAEDLGEEAFLARADRAFRDGLRLVQLREKGWPRERLAAFTAAMLPLAHAHGAKVLLNGTAEEARALGCDGVHWTAARLMHAETRPSDMLCAASCHDQMELARACALELDFGVLGPVLPTRSHPGAVPLGWERFAAVCAGTTVPVFALGGMRHQDLAIARANGAHGVASRSAAFDPGT